jgi:hypothetical protein
MQIKIEAAQTYKTEYNALKAVQDRGFDGLRFFIMTNEAGRFFPVFLGEAAVQAGVHFHFNVVG